MLKGRYQILKGYENNHVTIGFGSYGQVKLAKDVEAGNIVAVKIINKIAKNQIKMHDRLNHPKIIELIACHVDRERQMTYMILEYADEGTLFEKIKMGQLTKAQIRKYFRDVCEAVAYLHSEQIMHRDIKPENILLTKKNEAKLCDFGFAALLGERKTLCGTYEYMSPEMIQNRSYDYKIDVWALGILFFQLIAGHAPFRGQKPQEVFEQMKTKIYFCEKFEPEQINLIKTILRVTPSKRPTVEEILKDPMFATNKQVQKEETAYSTATEQSKAKNNSLQYLSQSVSSKKMAEIHKNIQKQMSKQPQNSFPFYVPKNQQKFEMGITLPYPETQVQKQLKSHSPVHYRPKLNATLQTSPNYYKNYQPQILNNNANRSLNGLVYLNKNTGQVNEDARQNVAQNQLVSHPSSNQQAPNQNLINHMNINKNNIGYGRFS